MTFLAHGVSQKSTTMILAFQVSLLRNRCYWFRFDPCLLPVQSISREDSSNIAGIFIISRLAFPSISTLFASRLLPLCCSRFDSHVSQVSLSLSISILHSTHLFAVSVENGKAPWWNGWHPHQPHLPSASLGAGGSVMMAHLTHELSGNLLWMVAKSMSHRLRNYG